MKAPGRRFAVSLFNALEIPFAVVAGLRFDHGDFLLGGLALFAAIALCFAYSYLKPYWDG